MTRSATIQRSGDEPSGSAALTTSLADYLDLLRPWLPRQLVGAESFENTREVAARLPGALAFSPFLFECRLGQPQAEADFLVSLTASNSGREILSGDLSDHDFSPGLFEHVLWQRLRHFGRQWAAVSHPLLRDVRETWLEFDVSQGPGTRMLPSLFFEPFRYFTREAAAGLDRAEVVGLVRSASTWTRGKPPSSTMVRTWEICIDRLPELRPLFIGFMLPRSDDTGIRLCANMPSVSALLDYLAAVGWRGNKSGIGGLLARIAPLADSLTLAFDAAESLGETIGVECQFSRRGDRAARIGALVKLLTEKGLCLPEKGEALLGFPGCVETDLAACPDPLRRFAVELGPGYRSLFEKVVLHLKIVFRPHGDPEAKGYLGFEHFWRGFLHELRGRGEWGVIG